MDLSEVKAQQHTTVYKTRILTCKHSQEPGNGIKLCGKKKDVSPFLSRSEFCFLGEKKWKDDLRANTRDKLWFRNVAHLGFLLWGLVKKKKRKTETLLKIKPLSLVFTQWGES